MVEASSWSVLGNRAAYRKTGRTGETSVCHKAQRKFKHVLCSCHRGHEGLSLSDEANRICAQKLIKVATLKSCLILSDAQELQGLCLYQLDLSVLQAPCDHEFNVHDLCVGL